MKMVSYPRLTLGVRTQLIRNSIANGIFIIVRFVSGFIVLPIMIGELKEAAYGIWVLVGSFSLIGYMNIFEGGIGSSVVKYVAEHKANDNSLAINQTISIAFWVYIVSALMAALSLFLFINYFFFKFFNIPPHLVTETRFLLYIMLLSLFLDFPSLALSSAIEGLQRYDVIKLIEVIKVLGQTICSIVLLINGYGLVALGVMLLCVSFYGFFSNLISLKHIMPDWRIVTNIPRYIIKIVLVFSGKMLFMRITAIVHNCMDKAIIGSFLIVNSLTNYSIASSIHAIASMMLSSISMVIIPTASMLKAKDDSHKLKKLYLKTTKYTLLICLPVTLFLMVVSTDLIHLWIGRDFVSTTWITRLYLVYLLWAGLTVTAFNILIGINKLNALLLIQTISTFINLFISVFTFSAG